MSRARLHLHLAALPALVVAAVAWSLAWNPTDARLALHAAQVFDDLGMIAASLAALACWRAIDRRTRIGTWKAGAAPSIGLLFPPLTAALAQGLARLRARELTHGDS